MQLYFHCSKTGKAFAADHYALVDNHGVVTDGVGGKILKVTAVLSPCPHCRELHSYAVEQISCPTGFAADHSQ